VPVLSIDRSSEVHQGRCEVLDDRRNSGLCGEPAKYRYPAMGGGFMRMCATHGEKHARVCETWTNWGGWKKT
jgi:hypothetical protein